MKHLNQKNGNKMFSSKVLETIKIFEEAGRHMSKEKFFVEMKSLYGKSVHNEDLVYVYRNIKASWKNAVHPRELRDYLLNKFIATRQMQRKNRLFPKPFKTIRVDCSHSIIGLFFRPSEELQSHEAEVFSRGQLKPYQKGYYLSVTSTGQLTTWSDSFKEKNKADLIKIGDLYSKSLDLHINSSAYVGELDQLAISTDKKELIFYDCSKSLDTFTLKHVFVAEKNSINTLNYWSDGTKAIFSFGDEGGSLTLLISYNVKKNGLFCSETCGSSSTKDHPLISTLFTKNSTRYLSFEIPIFFDACRQIRYCPSINTFAVCGTSSMKMGVVSLPPSGASNFVKIVLESTGLLGYFSCVAYSHSTKRLLTGGKDGSVRVWIPDERIPDKTLAGHFKPVTHIMTNPQERVFASLSEDLAVHVWSETTWVCLQILKVRDMGIDRISCMCYNLYNNELVLANSNIAKCLGKGTDLFKESLTSHEHPIQVLCYHSIFKLVISACQNGTVTVWDIETGKSVIEFNASADCMRLTALSIDGSHRRLVTATEDGQLRLWNFSSGTELAVLPITIPGAVTAIVCKNNRVFISQKKSKIIYNLGINGFENRYLEHEYLRDIFSMDVHKKTLVTASTNGNVVVWDVLTSVALFWFSSTTSPRMFTLSKTDQGRTGVVPVAQGGLNREKTYKASGTWTHTARNNGLIIKILRRRQASDKTATVLTSTAGYVYAWSIVREGGLLGKFRALRDKGEVITAMSTDVEERTLLTGDNSGKIYLWDITSFGLNMETNWPSEDIEGWNVPICTCVLLASWEGHRSDVLDVFCDTTGKHVVSAGLDYNVKMWTKTGRLLGLFGQGEWDINVRDCHLQTSEAPESISQVSPLMSTEDSQEDPEQSVSPEEATPESSAKSDLTPEPKTAMKNESGLLSLSHKELFALCRVLLPYRPLTYQLAKKKRQTKRKPLWKLYNLKLRLESAAHMQQEDRASRLQLPIRRRKKRPPPIRHTPVFHTTVRPYQTAFENAEKTPLGILTRNLESRHELLKYSWPTRIVYRRHLDHLRVRKGHGRGALGLSQRVSGRKRDMPWSIYPYMAGPKYTMRDINEMLTTLCKELELQSDAESDTSAETEAPPESKQETSDKETEEVEEKTAKTKDKKSKAKKHRGRMPRTKDGDGLVQRSPASKLRPHLLKLDQAEKTSARRPVPQTSQPPITEQKENYTLSDIEAFLVMYHKSSDDA